jgi:serine/threonine-protein kinase
MMQTVSKLAAVIGGTGLAIAAHLVSASAASAQDMYGAIATNDATGAWGYSYNYPTRAQAEANALQECGEQGCKVDVWFVNACGAVAKDGRMVGWGWAETRSEAEAQAVSACGSGACKVQVWACTTR